MDLHAFLMRNRSAVRIGLQLVAAIVGIEFLIMSLMELAGFSHDSLWTGVIDALLLGWLSSTLIYIWVVRPLKAARDQNSLYHSLVDNLSVGVVVTEPQDGELRITAVNPAFSRITGYTPEEMIGKHPRFMQGSDNEQPALQETRHAIRHGDAVRALVRNYRKDGTAFWNNLHLSPVRNARGEVTNWIGLVEDVTEQEELRIRSDLLQRAIEQGDEAVCVFDAMGAIEAVNSSYCRAVGAEVEGDLTGQSTWLWWDDTDASTEEAMAAVQLGIAWHGRHRRRRKDGRGYVSLTSISPVRDEHGITRFSSVHRDVTEMNEIEEQLLQAQKMEAVGTLAGGIAHDFNNMLAGMLGNLYLVQRDMQDHPDALKRLKRVEKQGYQAAEVIRQLLTFARSGVMEKKDFNMSPFLKEIIKFARPAIPENIRLVFEIDNSAMMVRGDPGRIQQAVLNLLTNARHAVEMKFGAQGQVGGCITLRAGGCGKRAACRGECHMRGQVDCLPDACVSIEVEDNGIGMDDATRGRIFDPYFSTKEVGRGTGLGLPMVQGCVELHGGCIEVESRPGEGSMFRCWLPLLSAGETAGGAVSETDCDVQLKQGNGELILVADDNSDAREALREMLEESGFKVVCAADGEEARQQFFVHQKELHAAFLDIVMPRCSGTVVAKYIFKVRPELPVVLMTGYDLRDTLASKEFMLHGKVDVLAKPWRLAQVNETLAKIRGHYAKAEKQKT